MKNKKNGFFTFCCSLVPGAGEMYMGLYKQGISLMLLFFSVGAIGGWIRLEVLWAIEPVIWFYSFFHTHNLRNMEEEEFLTEEDRYLVFNELDFAKADEVLKSNKKIVAAVLIFFGICMLAQIVINIFNPFLSGFLWDLTRRLNYNVVQIIVAVVAILSGVHLLKENVHNKKVEEEV